MRLPEGMTAAHAERLSRMPEDIRDRVRERAAIIWTSCPGISWEEADERALVAEGFVVQRSMLGGG